MDMLKALDLPISKAQLENIKRLENEHGKEHREDLSSYFYEKCFANYTKRILNIRQAKIRGEVIVAKPVLLLAIIDGINIMPNKVMNRLYRALATTILFLV